MKNPAELIGKKVRGFKFKKHWNGKMKSYIGLIGQVIKIYENNMVSIEFENGFSWSYPADQIEAHLVDEENEILTLSDGVMMLVSDDEKNWAKRKVIGKKENIIYAYMENSFILNNWKYAKPLEKEPTKEEQLTAILGSNDKVKEIMEVFNCK